MITKDFDDTQPTTTYLQNAIESTLVAFDGRYIALPLAQRYGYGQL